MVIVAVGQFAPSENTSENLDTIRRFATHAREDGVSLLVVPEYSSFMASRFDERLVENAQTIDGRFATAIRRIAREHRLAIVAGMVEQTPARRKVFNTVLLVEPGGRLAGTYRKLHLYDAFGFRESDWIVPGELGAAPIMDIDGTRFGVQTCYDLRFPESTRLVVDAGADAVVVPAQWAPGPMKEEHWTTLLRARAIENTIYVAGADQSGPNGSGHSMIIDPMGVVIAGLGDRVGIASALVDRERVEQVRKTNPVLSARRFRVVSQNRLVPVDGSAAW